MNRKRAGLLVNIFMALSDIHLSASANIGPIKFTHQRTSLAVDNN